MISEYMKQLSRLEMLSEKEEKRLWTGFKENGEMEARQKLITSYQPLVYKIVKQYTKDDHLMMDLIQEGIIGLIDAIEAFDYLKEVRFTTFALYYIRGRILDYLKKGVKDRSAALTSKNLQLIEQLNLGETLTEELVEKRFLMKQVIKVALTLPFKERAIIKKMYLEDKSASYVAEELEISLSYLYRLRKKAIKRLRGKLTMLIQQWS